MEQDLSAVLDDAEYRRSKSPTSIRSRTPYERPGQSMGDNGDLAMGGDFDGANGGDRDKQPALAGGGGGSGGGASGKKDCRVYVGNLAYEVGWQDLKDYMRKAGEVLFADVLTMPGGRSKGCGVVEYTTPEEAQRAIRELNDTPLLGRQVFVREDREADAKFGAAPRGGGGSMRGGSQNAIFVSNLPYIVAWQDLKDLFRQAGNVTRSDIHEGPDGRSKGTGLVAFETPTDVQNAISMFNGYDWHGRRIEVKEDMGHNGGGGGGGGDFHRGPPRSMGGYGGGGGPGGRACYKCGREGHIARACPEGGAPMGRGGYRDYPPRRDYYDQGRGYGGGGYESRMPYGGSRPAPYGYDRGGYDDYYGGHGGRGGYGGPPGPRDAYRDYPPPRGGYDYRGPPMGMNGGGGPPYVDYSQPGREYPPPGAGGVPYSDFR